MAFREPVLVIAFELLGLLGPMLCLTSILQGRRTRPSRSTLLRAPSVNSRASIGIGDVLGETATSLRRGATKAWTRAASSGVYI